MREIKFRVWDNNFKHMLLANDIKFVDGRMIGAKGVNWDSKVVVMQYTGLKDKNGVEIYEGDLLREEADGEWEQDNYMAYEVFWHDGNEADQHIGWQMNRVHFQGCLSGSSVWRKMLPKHTEKMYVIGNIYQNPELLNK